MKRQLISILTAFISLICLSVIVYFPIFLVFLSSFVFWLLVVIAIFVFLNKKNRGVKEIFFVIFTFICVLVVIMLLEQEILRYFMIALGTLVIWFLTFRSFGKKSILSHQDKPYRRIEMIVMVFDVYALTCFCFALALFFPFIPFWLLALFCSIVIGFVSLFIWKMYFNDELKGVYLWVAVLVFILLELMWVVHLLPLGYLISSWLIIWPWYILQLLIRFHLTTRGIVWKKQNVFLITNLFLYFLFLLYFARWI